MHQSDADALLYRVGTSFLWLQLSLWTSLTRPGPCCQCWCPHKAPASPPFLGGSPPPPLRPARGTCQMASTAWDPSQQSSLLHLGRSCLPITLAELLPQNQLALHHAKLLRISESRLPATANLCLNKHVVLHCSLSTHLIPVCCNEKPALVLFKAWIYDIIQSKSFT